MRFYAEKNFRFDGWEGIPATKPAWSTGVPGSQKSQNATCCGRQPNKHHKLTSQHSFSICSYLRQSEVQGRMPCHLQANAWDILFGKSPTNHRHLPCMRGVLVWSLSYYVWARAPHGTVSWTFRTGKLTTPFAVKRSPPGAPRGREAKAPPG